MKSLSRFGIVTLLSVTLSVIFPTGLNAQKNSHLPYAFGHTIETSMGWACCIDGPYGATHNILNSGIDYNLRYTYFWGRHFGAYAQFGINSLGTDRSRYFNSLDRNYSYTAAKYGSASPSEAYVNLMIGGAYRYDFGRWSLRPRLGIGYVSYDTNTYSYYRFSSPDSNPEKVFVNDSFTFADRLGIGAHLQLTYTVGDHFFFMAEISGLFVPGTFTDRTTIYVTEKTVPENWVEALIETVSENYIVTERIHESQTRRKIGDCVSIRIGIGWNIGFNRNTNNKYKK